MKRSIIRKFIAAILATLTFSIALVSHSQSSLFTAAEVDQSKFVVMAIPASQGNLYQLVIVEQITNARNCWSESGINPTRVEPLLLQFDFSGICGRATDSNG
ncbi:MAG: DUF3747 domain-containing protein, partial [Coleofasciculaceae cyanobacterium SM2_1_6]|nr:DUF3747 domain-containing protein [Coleofasciculaceae cyanobacterium SM2_1_6]